MAPWLPASTCGSKVATPEILPRIADFGFLDLHLHRKIPSPNTRRLPRQTPRLPAGIALGSSDGFPFCEKFREKRMGGGAARGRRKKIVLILNGN